MSDDGRHDGLADVINLLAAPIAGGIRTVEQMRRGIDEVIRTIDNLNTTIENLNEAAIRINRFMAEVEPAVLALLPQISRTVQAADQITSLLEGPVRATAPNVEKIVNALGSPGFLTLPNQVGELMQRLTPLAQLAENAGGLFGGFRLPGMGGGRPAGPTPPAARPAPAAPPPPIAADETAARRSTSNKSTTNNAAAKKTAQKKSAAKRTGTKKTAAEKPSDR
jgi:hypothetical protein